MFSFSRVPRSVGFVFVFATLITGSVQAQVFPRGNGISLADITQFDSYVQISAGENTGGDPLEFRLAVQQKLNTRLTSAGLALRPAGRDRLMCSVQVQGHGDMVAYSAAAQYWNIRSTDVHVLRWESGTLAIVPSDEFTASRIADDCAHSIITEWSKWNP